VLEEKAPDQNGDPGDVKVSYLIGLDVIGQQYDAEDIQFLGYWPAPPNSCHLI
jgi:hypothetical protein